MRRVQLTVLALSIIGAAGLAFAVVSCDSNAADPSPQGGKSDGTKGQHLLTSNTQSIGIEHATVTGGSISNLGFGGIEVPGFNTTGGLRSIMNNPKNQWGTALSGAWPSAANGGLRFETYDGGLLTSNLDVSQVNPMGELNASVNFTGGVIPFYSLVIYYCNGTIFRIPNVPFGALIRFQPPTALCCNWLRYVGFAVQRPTGYCVWRLRWDPCCCWRVFYNGIWYNDVLGTDFEEGQTGGAYPYHTIDEIRTLPLGGGVDNALGVRLETAYDAL